MELENCPFCGAKARFTGKADDYYELVEQNGRACLHIACTNIDCNCQMFVHSSSILEYEPFVEMATKQWNRRVGDEDQKSEDV
jgi:hypothetical protein